MRKILIATHGKFASGLKNSLEMFVGRDHFIETIDAYIEEADDMTVQLQSFIDQVENDDEAVIFTDLVGGSVNQLVVKTIYGTQKNIILISNCNMPVILATLLHYGTLDESSILEIIESAGVTRVELTKQETSEEDENDFFD